MTSNENLIDQFSVKLILGCIHVLIFIVGSISNCIAYLVFSRKYFQKTIFFVYFRFILIVDFMTLVSSIDYFLSFILGINLRSTTITCKILSYENYALPSISTWIIVVVSIDRVISVLKPTSFLIRKTSFFQLFTCILIFLYNALFYTPLLFSTLDLNLNNNSDDLNETTASYECIYFNPGGFMDYADFLNSTIIPFIFMTLSTIIILVVLYKSRKKWQQPNNTSNINSKNPKNSSIKRDLRFAFTSITLNVFFLIFNLPVVGFLMISNFVKIDLKYFDLIYLILLLLFYVNYGTMFSLSLVANKSFRKEFFSLIKSKKRYLFF